MLCIINLLFCFENHLVAISLLSRISFLKITHPFPLFGRVCLLIQCRFHWSFTHTERRNPPHWERGISFLFWNQCKAQLIRPAAGEPMLLLWERAPTIIPTEPCLPCQYTHKEPTALRQILFMGSRLQFLRRPAANRERKGRFFHAFNAQRTLFPLQRGKAHIRARPILLRTQIRDIHFINRDVVKANIRGCLPVAVILLWPAPQIGERFIAGRRFKAYSNLRQLGKPAIRLELQLNQHARLRDGIGQHPITRRLRGDDKPARYPHYASRCILRSHRIGRINAVLPCKAPHGAAHRHMVSPVVIRASTPEGRAKRSR